MQFTKEGEQESGHYKVAMIKITDEPNMTVDLALEILNNYHDLNWRLCGFDLADNTLVLAYEKI